MTPDTLAGRTLPAALRAVRAARRRVAKLAREHADADPWALVALCRAELAKFEPALARVLAGATLAGWVLAARRPALDAVPVTEQLPNSYRTPVESLQNTGKNPVEQLPNRLPPPPPSEIHTTFSDETGRPVVFPLVEAAARDLMARQVVTRSEYDALAAQAKAAAFTVARVLTADAVETVRDAVHEATTKGLTLRQFRRETADAVGDALSESQVESVFRTSVAQAQAAGTRAALNTPVIADEFPYILYSAINDARTRPDHRWLAEHGLDGTGVYRADDPVIRKWHPPCGYNCRCHAVLLSIEDAAARGVREARTWLATGVPPTVPARAPVPPFDLPRGWPRADEGIQPVLGW